MRVVLATAKAKVLETDAVSVVLPSAAGQIEILPGHIGLLTLLDKGQMRVKSGENQESARYMLHGGFAQVQDNHVYVLSENAEKISS